MTDSTPQGRDSYSDDEFDRIVAGLDLEPPSELDETGPFADDMGEFADGTGQLAEGSEPLDNEESSDQKFASAQQFSSDSSDEDEQFYRRVQPVARPWRLNTIMAWSAVIGAPILLVLASTSSFYLSRPLMAALALVFLAGSAALMSSLPEHGPAEDDFGDDGAVL